ncbi:MAG TPA: type II CAAX endopeptidase family protein [Longimicrobium sp.]|nr:type II CAAX endopeptidase family protein [Longimicrobium sp.]
MTQAPRPTVPPLLLAMRGAAIAMLLWFGWQALLAQLFEMPPAWAIGWMALLAIAFVALHAWPRRWNRRIRAAARPRGFGRSAGWLALTAPAMVALPLSLWVVLTALGLLPDQDYPAPVTAFVEQPGGEAAFVVLAVAMAPLMEEFAFRGWLLGALRRPLGAGPAVMVSALLFALAHARLPAVPIYLAAGLVLGQAALAARSVWAAVALHACWNAGLLAVDAAFPGWDPEGKGWVWAGPAAAVAALSVMWCAWGVQRMHDRAALRPAGPGGAARGRPVESP